MKDSTMRPTWLLQPLPIPNQVFDTISMDFITCLLASRGKTTVMVVVDKLSKYGHFIGLPAKITSENVAAAFIAEIIHLHSIPATVITDRDPKFMHCVWQEVSRLQGTEPATSTASILKQMGKLKLSTTVLRCIFDALLQTRLMSGFQCSLGPNIGITRPIKLQQE